MACATGLPTRAWCAWPACRSFAGIVGVGAATGVAGTALVVPLVGAGTDDVVRGAGAAEELPPEELPAEDEDEEDEPLDELLCIGWRKSCVTYSRPSLPTAVPIPI